MWAGEQYIGHSDGYSVRPGASWPNNYYLHSDDGRRFRMLPSGLDQTFILADPFPGDPDGLLAANCLADSSCLRRLPLAPRRGRRRRRRDARRGAPRRDRRHRRPLAAVRGPRARKRRRLADGGDPDAGVRPRPPDAVATYLGAPPPARDPALDSTAPPALSTAGCPTDPPQDAPPTSPADTRTRRRRGPPLPPRLSRSRAPDRRPAPPAAPHRAHARARRRLHDQGLPAPPRGRRTRGRLCGGRVTVRAQSPAGGRSRTRAHRARLRFDCTYCRDVLLQAAGAAEADRAGPLQRHRQAPAGLRGTEDGASPEVAGISGARHGRLTRCRCPGCGTSTTTTSTRSCGSGRSRARPGGVRFTAWPRCSRPSVRAARGRRGRR